MMRFSDTWPVLTTYDQAHLARVALPLGGIGTGTVSLGGRGNLRDWEIVNRPAKGFIPPIGQHNGPFFALYAETSRGKRITRLLEGPLDVTAYEGSHGSRRVNHGLPRFRDCAFAAAYPFGQVYLSDDDVPLDIRLEAFNPFIPADAEQSGLPIAVLRYVLLNPTDEPITASICGTLPNFIGQDGARPGRTWRNEPDYTVGPKDNHNAFRQGDVAQGLYMWSDGLDPHAETWGTLALATTPEETVTYRTAWAELSWGDALLDFWDDFGANGELAEREQVDADGPVGSLAVKVKVPPSSHRAITFVLAWHFPNRFTWQPRKSPADECGCASDRVGNYYATCFADAWDTVGEVMPQLSTLEQDTTTFVRALVESDLPDVIKEAALYNASTLRTQTCFRIEDGTMLGWEGSCDTVGCCFGSCTHVWNYEQTTAFLFGDLAKTMREVEFAHATDERGLMSFRVQLPLSRAQEHGLAAADGQMGCLMKLYRDWQLSGDDAMLRRLWPKARNALDFCWIEGGWDADQDGVMEGCQHNTMDVEYYGPNPQMGVLYLGALRAAEEMAHHLGESDFAQTCRRLFEHGSQWIDTHLFNGEYYEHEIRPPGSGAEIAAGLRAHMGAEDLDDPALQLGPGCLVDQLVGQYMAHVCGLGYLVESDHVRSTLRHINAYNYQDGFYDHFNHLRSFVLGDEAGLLMATYPHGNRPRRPFPYYNEVMTGFEYTAAAGMLYEDQVEAGLRCIRAIRDRYDGRKRSPFDEAECGHHYARAMAAWASLLAWTGFRYSAVTGDLRVGPRPGAFFWSNGHAWGTYMLQTGDDSYQLDWRVLQGRLTVARIAVSGQAEIDLANPITLGVDQSASWMLQETSTEKE